jgi:hypothetical protein
VNESNNPKWESRNRTGIQPVMYAMRDVVDTNDKLYERERSHHIHHPTSIITNFAEAVEEGRYQSACSMGQVTSSKITQAKETDNVYLPMSNSSDLLATKAAEESELRRRVESLQAELRSATTALEHLQKSGDAPAGQDAGELTLRSTATTGSIAPPPGKKGYLFKWLDRSIGVSFVH